jgi:hypothetical protein
MPNDLKNVFISHVHEDDAGLAKTKKLLGDNGMDIRDASINSSNPNNAKSPDYIMNEYIAPGIRWASTLLVYITPKTKESAWVDKEIEYAEKQGKRIVGVWAHGHNECEVPEALKKYADAVVGWNGQNIIDAINGKKNGWEQADGSTAPKFPIKPHPC